MHFHRTLFLLYTPFIIFSLTRNFSVIWRSLLQLYEVCGVHCAGEAVNYSAGLGFSGYDENGRSKWNLLDNAEVFYVEVVNVCLLDSILVDVKMSPSCAFSRKDQNPLDSFPRSKSVISWRLPRNKSAT